MKSIVFCLNIICLSLVCCVTCLAQADRPGTTAPLVEDSTFAVLQVDLESIDFDGLTDWILRLQAHRDGDGTLDRVITAIRPWVAAVRQTGADSIDVTLSLNDVWRLTPVIQARTNDPQTLQARLADLWNGPLGNYPLQSKQIDGHWMFGARPSLGRLPSNASDFTARLSDRLVQPSLDHRLLVTIVDSTRQDLAAIWSDRPIEGFPGVSLQQLASDVKLIDLQWSFPPEPAVRAKIECEDNSAASRIRDIVQASLSTLPGLDERLQVTAEGSWVRLESDPRTTAEALAMVLDEAYRSAQRMRASNSLKQIGLALHNYYAKEKKLMPIATTDPDGRALLSWRVALLPYLEQAALQQQINQTQSWDHAANRRPRETQVPVYQTLGARGADTLIRMPVIRGSAWHEDDVATVFGDINDGTSNTIAMAIAPPDQAVPWMKPGTWQLDEANLIDSFFGDQDSTLVLFFDGSVHRLERAQMTEQKLRAWLTNDGGESVEWSSSP